LRPFAVPAGAVLVRVALVLPVVVIEDAQGTDAFRVASARVRGRVWSSAVLLLLGVAAPALLAGWTMAEAERRTVGELPGLALWLARDLVLIAVAALQAKTLLAAYRQLSPGPELGPAGVGQDDTVHRGRRLHRLALPVGVALLLLPTVLAGAVIASERLPEVSVAQRSDHGTLIALGWPAGRHPVVVSRSAIEDCLDDQCQALRKTELSLTVFKANGGVAVAPDGGVYALSQHEVEHCDAQRVCRRAAGRLEVLAGSQLEAIALAPNGDILIATATPTPRRKPSAESPETTAIALALVRCKDVFCEHPEVRDLGSVQGGFDDRYSSSWFRTLMVGTDRSGRPVVGFRHLGMVWIGQCGTAACDAAQLGVQANPRDPGLPTDEELRSLHFDRLVHCDSCREASATVDRPGGGVYGITVEPAPPAGVHIRVGQPTAPPNRALLLSCQDHRCSEPDRIPLVEFPSSSFTFYPESPEKIWLLAANPDGRVVLAQQHSPDRIVTVRG
jgi:hypothetical protein